MVVVVEVEQQEQAVEAGHCIEPTKHEKEQEEEQ